MRLSKNTVVLIVVLLSLALGGLMVIQTILFRDGLESREAAFSRNVSAALSGVSQKLEFSSTLSLSFTMDGTDSLTAEAAVFAYPLESQSLLRSERIMVGTADTANIPRVWIDSGQVRYHVPSPQHVQLKVFDPVRGEQRVVVDTFTTPGNYQVTLDSTMDQPGEFLWSFQSDSMSVILHAEDGQEEGSLLPDMADSTRVMFVYSVLNRLRQSEHEPIEERLDTTMLDSIISYGLKGAGIEEDYAYAVYVAGDPAPRIISDPEYRKELAISPHRVQLFPMYIFAERADLTVYFPEHRSHIWFEMGILIVPSLVMILIIIGCFVYTIRTIVIQRRFGEMMVEFINNMTHEFKTPISTIQLVCEAIAKPEVARDPARMQQYNSIINSENRRMRNQAEKILQMAVIEEGDTTLKTETVDVHDLLRKAVDSVAVHIEAQNGTITCDLSAQRYHMKADPIHLGNVFRNLLDNAVKYSPEHPTIAVTTANAQNGLRIVISDNGIGMSAMDCKMAFEKYFRVPQGNIHDVKGFGLGLSYVKLMVAAHSGDVILESEVGKGTRAVLRFPPAVLVDEVVS